MRTNMNIREFFRDLNGMKINYAVLNGSKFFNSGVDPIIVLVDRNKRERVIKTLGVEYNDKTDKDKITFDVEQYRFHIIPTKKDYFPEKMESDILYNSVIIDEDPFYSPTPRMQVLCDIYRAVVHLDCIKNNGIKNRLKKYIEEKYIIVRSKNPYKM